MNGNDEVLGYLKSNDATFIEITLDGSTATSTLKIVPTSYSATGGYARFTYCGIHFVTERFRQYLQDMLATIMDLDGGGYVTIANLNAALAALKTELTGEYDSLHTTLTELYYRVEHMTCETIGAASANHTHPPASIGAAAATHTHTPASLGAATADHTHDEYMTDVDAQELIATSVAEHISEIVDTSPMLFLSGAVGVIPTEFREYNIVPPIQVILPSVIKHDAETVYDFDMGLVSSPQTPVAGYPLSNFMCGIDGNFVKFVDETAYVHYTFHINRVLSGYRILFPDDSKAHDWYVYADLNTFVHHIHSDDTSREIRVTFTEDVDCSTLSFKFSTFDLDAEGNWGVQVSPIFKDIEANCIGFTDTPVRLASSNSGHTAVYDVVLPDKLAPAAPVKDVPLYIYTDIDHATGDTAIGYTYVRPEFGTIPFGDDILTDQFLATYKDDDGNYLSDLFGSVAITEATDPDSAIAVFKSEAVNYDSVDKLITYYFNFDKTPLAICGYEIFWKCTDDDGDLDETIKSRIPEGWSLVITSDVVDENGDVTETDIVLDSVNIDNRNLSMFGNLDVTYYKHFKKKYYVKSARLSFNTTNNFGMVITQIKPLLLEDFYCVPENTMYHLESPANRFYLGTAIYKEFQMGSVFRNGYVVRNQVLGKHCSVPVNNLNACDQFETYEVANPYNCKELSISIRTVLSDDDTPPHAVIMSVTSKTITICAYTAHRFVLDITRTW